MRRRGPGRRGPARGPQGPRSGRGPPAPGPERPAYRKLRYDEDYAWLRDPERRGDFWDPIKYLPLDSDGRSYLSLGGDARWRYEYYGNYRFDPDAPDTDGHLLQRCLLHADLHVGAWARAFGQLQSGLENGRAGGPRGTDEDRLDLHQAFVDLRLPFRAGSGDDLTFASGARRCSTAPSASCPCANRPTSAGPSTPLAC